MKVFLGGTCNKSKWRDELVKGLLMEHFNPVVEDWTEEAQKDELKQREVCDIVLYVITPEMLGFYSIAEVVDDSNKRPQKTVFCVLNTYDDKSFDRGQIKSSEACKDMVRKNGGKVFSNLDEVRDYLNNLFLIQKGDRF